MENQRIRVTKTMLRSGLLQLLGDTDFNKITIQEICNAAEINRSTFYRYYDNQMDLLKEIEKDFFSQMDNHLKSIITSEPDALMAVLNYLYEQKETFVILISSIPHEDFSSDLFASPSIQALFQNMLSSISHTELEAQYISEFIFQGTLSILCTWLKKENPEPVSEVIKVIKILRDKLKK